MPRDKLTKRLVDNIEKPAEGKVPVFYWDTVMPGLGLSIASSGKRSFCVNYVTEAGERKRMVIGSYPAITCEEARSLAKVHLGNVAKGADPSLDRKTRRQAITVGEWCDRYLEDAERGAIRKRKGQPKKASTLALDRGRVERHVKPLIGRLRLIDLAPSDIHRFHRDVAAGKTAKVYRNPGSRTGNARVTGGTGTARRVVGMLGAILEEAKLQGVIQHNPARGVQRGTDGVRDRRLTADEYRALGDALRAFEAEGEHWQLTAAVRLLALSGCRRGEVQNLAWSEVDEPGGCLRLNDTKTGKSIRPAGRAVFETLAKLPRAKAAELVLPPVYNASRFLAAKGIERLCKRAGLEGVSAHTLRHSYASTAADLGMALPTISALLGHSVGGVTSRYVHMLDSVLIAAADKVAREIERQMDGPKSAEILQFPGNAAAV